MNKADVLQQVEAIFKDVLDEDDIVLTESTTAADVEEWDSLAHVQLVVALEKHFKVKFTSKEMLAWKNVGDMVEAICGKAG